MPGIQGKQIDLSSPPPIGSTTPNTIKGTSFELSTGARWTALDDGLSAYLVFQPSQSGRSVNAVYYPSGDSTNYPYSFEFHTKGSGTNEPRLIFLNDNVSSGAHIIAGDIKGSATGQPLIFRAGSGDWSSLPDGIIVGINDTVSIRNPRLTNLSPTAGNLARFSATNGAIVASTGLIVDGSGNLTTPSVLLSNSGFTNTVLPGTLGASRTFTLPTTTATTGDFLIASATGNWVSAVSGAGLRYSTANQTLTSTSTGNNSAIALSASGTAATQTTTNTNATIGTAAATFTRSSATAGLTTFIIQNRTGSTAAANGGESIFNSLSSTSTTLKVMGLQYQAVTNVAASYTSKASLVMGDGTVPAGRPTLDLYANNTRSYISTPSGVGAAFGSGTDPGANNISVAGVVKLGVYTVATLPTASASGNGAIAHASNGRKSGEGAAAGTGVPAWCDATNWKTYYDNSTVAA